MTQSRNGRPPEWWEDAGLDAEIGQLADDILGLQREIEAKKEAVEEKRSIIQALMESVKSEEEGWTAYGSGWQVVHVAPSKRRKLVPEKLIQNGVTIEQIEKSYQYSKSKAYVSVKFREEE